MKQAEVFLLMECECPNCGLRQEVDFAYENENALLETDCDGCDTIFSYCHPENTYGLSN
jgi:sarcosine oxidase delta subunit